MARVLVTLPESIGNGAEFLLIGNKITFDHLQLALGVLCQSVMFYLKQIS